MKNGQKGLIFLIGVAALAGVFLLLTPRAQIDAVVNPDGKLPAYAPLTITFNQPMNHASVEAAVKLSPARSGEWTWQGNQMRFAPQQPWPASAQVTVSLESGVLSIWYLPSLRAIEQTFQVAPPQLLYLWPFDGSANLFALDTRSGESRPLTDAPLGVLDYSAGWRGQLVIYAARNTKGGSDVFLWERASGAAKVLFSCGQVACSGLALSPDGNQLAFTRESGSRGLYLFDMASGQQQLISPPEHQISDPLWSVEGALAYYDQTAQSFVIWQNGEISQWENQAGGRGVWSPSGGDFYYASLVSNSDGTISSHIMRLNLRTGQRLDLTASTLLEDASPVISPDGLRLTFARKYLFAENWTPGRQLWEMNPDGSGAKALSEQPDFNHSAMVWSPDGAYLAFLRTNVADYTQPPEIWLLKSGQTEPVRVMIGGYFPQWMP